MLPFGQKAPLDWRVFGFVAGVSMLTGIVFGLLPALRATRVDLAGAMKESSRSVTGSRTVVSKGLVVLQVAMSLVLLVGAGLFLRTLENLKSVDVGFDSRNLLMFNVNPRVNGYDVERSSRLFGQVLERLETLPGVTSVALTRAPLLSATTFMDHAWKQGQTSHAPAVETMFKMDVSPAFFATMGIPMLRGRSFTDRDGPAGPKVAILNEAAARALFPDGDALGRRIGESFEKAGEFEVVGVVRDTKYASVREPGPPTMYRSVWQSTQRNLHVVLKTAGEPLAMSETVRAAMREIDPTVPIQAFTSQSERISQRFAQERLFARAYAAFGALAVLLACIGLFGLMSYNVARRTSEIGVRMALGAQRRAVVGMVMGESIRLVAIGIGLGLGATLWAGRFVQTVVYGLSPSDPLTIGGAVALLAIVTAFAGGVPGAAGFERQSDRGLPAIERLGHRLARDRAGSSAGDTGTAFLLVPGTDGASHVDLRQEDRDRLRGRSRTPGRDRCPRVSEHRDADGHRLFGRPQPYRSRKDLRGPQLGGGRGDRPAGVVITGDAAFLKPYEAGTAEVKRLTADLRTLTADNPRQQQRLTTAESLLASKLEELGGSIALRRRAGFEPAMKLVASGEGKR